MRFTLALTLALVVAGPSYAQIDEEFTEANRIFGQLSSERVLEDIDGEWLPLTTLSNLQGADPDPGLISAYLERICGNDPVRGAVLTGLDGTSFEMIEANTGGEMVYRYDWIAGAEFYRSFDPETLFRVRKFDTMEGERGVEMRARLLDANADRVKFYRVSADLLTMVMPERVEVFGRCPG